MCLYARSLSETLLHQRVRYPTQVVHYETHQQQHNMTAWMHVLPEDVLAASG